MPSLEELVAGIELFGYTKKFINWIKNKRIDEPYYFDEYNKKVFVKNNGDGVIVWYTKLHVVDPVQSNRIIRTVDITDAKEDSEFPPVIDMIAQGNKAPFETFGMWHKSDNDIVTDIVEVYDEADEKRKEDKKFLSFQLVLNSAALEENGVYNITFAISIPGLFRIENGRYSGTIDEHKKEGTYKTSLTTYRTQKLLSYSIYTEQNMVFSKKPHAICKGAKTKGVPVENKCKYRNNMFYEKFSFTLENPQEYDIIYMEWDLKNQIN